MDPDDPDPPTSEDYNLSGGSWSSTSLRFFFDNGTSDISGTGERDIVRRAFHPWAAVTPLRFAETAIESDAQFSFAWRTGDHGDGSSFDGSGNVYAHGFYPRRSIPDPSPAMCTSMMPKSGTAKTAGGGSGIALTWKRWRRTK